MLDMIIAAVHLKNNVIRRVLKYFRPNAQCYNSHKIRTNTKDWLYVRLYRTFGK